MHRVTGSRCWYSFLNLSSLDGLSLDLAMTTADVPEIMDLDTAYIEPLIYEWLEHVHRDNARQEQIFADGNEFIVPYVAVPLPVIKTIFVISGHFSLGPNTRYLTVHLFDSFMCNRFRELYAAETEEDATGAPWANICETISSQAKLGLMSCMQLASKMDSHSKGLGIAQVMRMLRWLGDKSEYTKNAIYCSEFNIYKTVDFKIPLFTPLHCVEILLAATKLGQTPQIYRICVDLLDLAYLQHDRIYSRLQFMIRQRFLESQVIPENVMALESNILYLGAAVVLCSIFFLSVEDSDTKSLLKKLSNLVGITENNIWELAKLLFTIAASVMLNWEHIGRYCMIYDEKMNIERPNFVISVSQFIAFSKYGDKKSNGTLITLTQSDKWMKQALVLDKKITPLDAAICFSKFKQKSLSFSDYNKFIRDLAASKGLNPKEIFNEMTSCGPPGSSDESVYFKIDKKKVVI